MRDYYARNKEICLARVNRYRKANKELINSKKTEAYRTNIKSRLSTILRNRLRIALNRKSKSGSAVKDLGCSIDEFKLYIQNQFQDGMSWDNHGIIWELDHVVPLNQFDLTDRIQFLEACNWLNIRPLFNHENNRRERSIRNF